MNIIVTQRLIIRPFKAEDAAALFDYLSSPRAPCFKDEKLHSLAEAKSDVAIRIVRFNSFYLLGVTQH